MPALSRPHIAGVSSLSGFTHRCSGVLAYLELSVAWLCFLILIVVSCRVQCCLGLEGFRSRSFMLACHFSFLVPSDSCMVMHILAVQSVMHI